MIYKCHFCNEDIDTIETIFPEDVIWCITCVGTHQNFLDEQYLTYSNNSFGWWRASAPTVIEYMEKCKNNKSSISKPNTTNTDSLEDQRITLPKISFCKTAYYGIDCNCGGKKCSIRKQKYLYRFS